MAHSHADHGHGHDHDHDHSHTPTITSDNERKVLLSFGLIFTFMAVEVVGGLLSGSLALLADAYPSAEPQDSYPVNRAELNTASTQATLAVLR